MEKHEMPKIRTQNSVCRILVGEKALSQKKKKTKRQDASSPAKKSTSSDELVRRNKAGVGIPSTGRTVSRRPRSSGCGGHVKRICRGRASLTAPTCDSSSAVVRRNVIYVQRKRIADDSSQSVRRRAEATSSLLGRADVSIASVYLAMTTQVRDDREMAAAAVKVAAECCIGRILD